ncbi:amidohydrolase family protein [Altererythrobacter endophyticus]|uniref:Amidohydrolase family protein n=2 Tax=Altericroceibacterium endophyticum TaxID=1808508 RepID=A0A6I4T9X2_9SPHN|nr:amidohydrolase family protein [Altericroceibacterium endophyticum]MXO67092.1 amidohydrolase family protein [Altericroceibacterium endophyticum]
MTLRLFDTHAHLIADDWDAYPAQAFTADLPVPDRPDYTMTADHLITLMDRHSVRRACLVQRGHVYGYDNSYIINSAHRYPERLHPVVILDTQDPDTPTRYHRMVRDDHVAGFRMANSRPWLLDTAWLSSPAAMDVWRICADLGTPVTLIFFMNQLPYLLPLLKMLAQEFADLPIILDHGAMPFGMTQYEVALAEEAGRAVTMPAPPDFGIDTTIAIFEDVPNVHFKITEINMERLIKADRLPQHLLRRMVDSFGPDRLIWGSDIGQSMLWDYAEKVSMAQQATQWLTEAETARFLHDNAARLYGFGDA